MFQFVKIWSLSKVTFAEERPRWEVASGNLLFPFFAVSIEQI